MRTNFQMLRELNEFTPQNRGFITGEEKKHIENTLCLNEMDELALNNMRDFAVAYYSDRANGFERDEDIMRAYQELDMMSAITGVIDNILWNKGYEV